MAEITPVDKNGTIITKGMRVRIPKGTYIHGTFKEREKLASRNQVVTVFAADTGFDAIPGNNPDVAPSIVWPGSGGYWHHCAAAEVEII
jgi:hypothetical protein